MKRGRLLKRRRHLLPATTFFACPGHPLAFDRPRHNISDRQTVITLGHCPFALGVTGVRYNMYHILTSTGVVCVYAPTLSEYFEEL